MKNVSPVLSMQRDIWKFILYVDGQQAATRIAESALLRLCDHFLPNRYAVEIVDITDPEVTIPPDILAVPTTIRLSPGPERRVIGDLSNFKKAAQGFGLTEKPFLKTSTGDT